MSSSSHHLEVAVGTKATVMKQPTWESSAARFVACRQIAVCVRVYNCVRCCCCVLVSIYQAPVKLNASQPAEE